MVKLQGSTIDTLTNLRENNNHDEYTWWCTVNDDEFLNFDEINEAEKRCRKIKEMH